MIHGINAPFRRLAASLILFPFAFGALVNQSASAFQVGAKDYASSKLCAANLPPPVIRVVNMPPQMVYRYDLSANQISEIARGMEAEKPGVSHYLGLTKSSLRVQTESQSSTVTLNNGFRCASYETVVNLGFNKITVYVAQELVADRCSFEHVLSHEMQHVAFHNEAARLTTNRLNLEASDYIGNGEATSSWFGAGGASSSVEDLSRRLMDRAKQLFVQYNVRHQEIDTPAQYAGNSAVCGGAISRLMKRSLMASLPRNL